MKSFKVSAEATIAMTKGQTAKKTLKDVQSAFESREIFDCSTRQLEELLATIASETIPDPTIRAHAAAMSQTIRELLARKRLDQTLRRSSKLNRAAFVMALIALLCSAAPLYYFWGPLWRDRVTHNESDGSNLSAQNTNDPRTHFTLWELAHFAPSIRKGSLQAWWAGEQARQVQRLETMAKKQALAGDLEGAARSAERADAIRGDITSLADFEKPLARQP